MSFYDKHPNYELIESERDVKKALKHEFIDPFSSRSRFLRSVRNFFPIITWLPNYNYQEYLYFDIIGGVTAGVLHVTQGKLNFKFELEFRDGLRFRLKFGLRRLD